MNWHKKHEDSRSLTNRIADRVAACSFSVFVVACLIVIVWGISGPYFHYSDTWQLVINTGTTIVTFLMAFLIGSNQLRQGERDLHQAEADYQTNLRSEAKIEEHYALTTTQSE